jgi:putative DNA primase/helicase
MAPPNVQSPAGASCGAETSNALQSNRCHRLSTESQHALQASPSMDLLRDFLNGRFGIFDVACPACGPTRRSSVNRVRRVLRVWHLRDGLVRAFCIRCRWTAVVRDRHQHAQPEAPQLPVAASSRSRAALDLWSRGVNPTGSIVELYLGSRSLLIPNAALHADVLRFHPSCPFGLCDEVGPKLLRVPAMLALQRDIVSDEPRAVHRTALLADGRGKFVMPDGSGAKRVLGPARGTAIKLSPDDSVTSGLAIAEGLETGLAAMCIGIAPLWVVHGAGGIAHFPLLAGVETLTIIADSDEAGLSAAQRCTGRWREAGRVVRLVVPKEPGADLNDMLRGNA